jgi:uncharacterized membrane protein
MRRLALFLVPLALTACQRQAQNAPPATAPVQATTPELMPIAPPASTAEPAPATPAPKATPAMPPKPDLPVTPPKAAEDFKGDLNLTGTEPFWGVQIRKDRITLSRPDHPDISAPNPGPSVSGETASWDAGEMTVTLKAGRCSDGMSDRVYPYSATVSVGKETLKGCAYNPARTPRMPH